MPDAGSEDNLPAGSADCVVQPDFGHAAFDVERHGGQPAAVRREPHIIGADLSGAGSGKPFARPVHPDELRAVDIGLVSKHAASRNRKVGGAGRAKGRDAAGDGLGLRGDTAPGEIEGLREQRSGTQVDQIAAIGAERTRVLDAGIGLDNLDTWIVAAGRGDASTQGAELRIVDGVKKVAPARQHLRPGIHADRSGAAFLQTRASRPSCWWLETSRRSGPKGIAEEKYGTIVREDLTRSRVYRDTAQLALRGKQQHPAVRGPDDRICPLAVGNRTGLQFREVAQEEAERSRSRPWP